MTPEEWNLLNAAQRIIPKLSDAQRRAMMTDDTGFAEQWKGHISCWGNPATARVLHRLQLIERNDTLSLPTALGHAVRSVLQGRDQ